MKKANIIQSFAYFDEGNIYIKRTKNSEEAKKEKYTHLSFYTYLLSYLTLKEFYGHVTMHTNQKGYDKLIKYIPYDDVVIRENKYDHINWSMYKLDSMENSLGDVIHVDSDVFIFDNLFHPFLENNDFDMLVQNKTKLGYNYIYENIEFIKDNEDFLYNNEIVDLNKYDYAAFSCGIFGLRERIKKTYFEKSKIMFEYLKEVNPKVKWYAFLPMFNEELLAYLIANKNNYNVHEILPFDVVRKIGERKAGNYYKLTHLWLQTKFDPSIIKLVKRKIENRYSDMYYLVEKFDKDIYFKKYDKREFEIN